MKRTKYKELYQTSGITNILLQVSELPTDLEPNDQLVCRCEDDYCEFTILRPYEETDEEYSERLKGMEQVKTLREKADYRNYLILHERFKNYTPNEENKT